MFPGGTGFLTRFRSLFCNFEPLILLQNTGFGGVENSTLKKFHPVFTSENWGGHFCGLSLRGQAKFIEKVDRVKYTLWRYNIQVRNITPPKCIFYNPGPPGGGPPLGTSCQGPPPGGVPPWIPCSQGSPGGSPPGSPPRKPLGPGSPGVPLP